MLCEAEGFETGSVDGTLRVEAEHGAGFCQAHSQEFPLSSLQRDRKWESSLGGEDLSSVWLCEDWQYFAFLASLEL